MPRPVKAVDVKLWLHVTLVVSCAASGEGPHAASSSEAGHTAPLDSWAY